MKCFDYHSLMVDTWGLIRSLLRKLVTMNVGFNVRLHEGNGFLKDIGLNVAEFILWVIWLLGKGTRQKQNILERKWLR